MKICQLPSTPKNNSSNVQLNIHKISALMIKAYNSKVCFIRRANQVISSDIGRKQGLSSSEKNMCIYIYLYYFIQYFERHRLSSRRCYNLRILENRGIASTRGRGWMKIKVTLTRVTRQDTHWEQFWYFGLPNSLHETTSTKVKGNIGCR